MPTPNIVFVMADQLRLQSCGYAGDALAMTPNIDRMASESVDFRSMVASMPVCAASRASLFTGKHTTSTGMVINEIRMNTNHRCLAHCLNDSGYQTAYIGKWHLYANELGNHTDPKNSYVPRGPDRLGFDGFWAAYNFHHEYYGANAYYHTESSEKIHFTDGTYEPDGQTDLAVSWMRDHAGDAAPFYLQLCWGAPHDPWEQDNVPQGWMDKFSDVEFPLPPNYSQVKDPHGDSWSNIDQDPEQLRAWKRVYYAMTSSIDECLGRLRAALTELGLADNTVVIFTSDHGEMFGAHGRMKKNIFYEEAARVPFLVHVPQDLRKPGVTHGAAGSVIDACVSYVDIMPTILGLVGAEIPRDVEGMDVSHIIVGESFRPAPGHSGQDRGPRVEPEFAFLQNTGACASWENGHEWRAIRDKQYTYAIFRSDGQELLFDNIVDPYQMHNLVEDPSHLDALSTMRVRMKAKMATINDRFEESLYYREHWVSEDRRILRSATVLPDGPQ